MFGIQLIDRVGRRRLLLWGAIGMCVCEFIVAIVSCMHVQRVILLIVHDRLALLLDALRLSVP